MPIKTHMTYVPQRKRWQKKYKGVHCWVSCQQLGCPASKEASALAANQWWEAKQKELDALAEASKPQHSPSATALLNLAGATSVADLDRLATQGQAAERLRHVLEELAGLTPTACFSEQSGPLLEEARQALETLRPGSLDPSKVDKGLMQGTYATPSLTEEERLAQLHEIQAVLLPTVQPDRTFTHNTKAWLGLLDAKVRANKLSLARRNAYEVEIGRFESWMGAKSIDDITATVLDSWYVHLTTQIAEQRWASSTARLTFMSTRQFISYLAERGTIQAPANLRSRQFVFSDGDANVETFEVEELHKFLSECDVYSRRMKLYLLLCLNCGMYQADISDLSKNEADLKAGTIKRRRSKRRRDKRAKIVTYKLWPETLELLREFRAKEDVNNDRGEPRFLLTEDGNPLVMCGEKRYDTIQSAYLTLMGRVDVRRLPISTFRKNAANELGKHREYKFYTGYFLAHGAKGTTERNYVNPSDEEFFEALAWLRLRLLPGLHG